MRNGLNPCTNTAYPWRIDYFSVYLFIFCFYFLFFCSERKVDLHVCKWQERWIDLIQIWRVDNLAHAWEYSPSNANVYEEYRYDALSELTPNDQRKKKSKWNRKFVRHEIEIASAECRSMMWMRLIAIFSHMDEISERDQSRITIRN